MRFLSVNQNTKEISNKLDSLFGKKYLFGLTFSDHYGHWQYSGGSVIRRKLDLQKQADRK